MKEYYTREEIVKDDFLFISYKHEVSDSTVMDVLGYLYEQGVRFWYDADLGVGQNWTEVAYELIMHSNCRGVVFFNSVDSFTSEPVHKERSYALEKLSKCKKEGATFTIFPVNIGYPSVLEIIRAVFAKIPDIKRLSREFPLEYIQNIAQLFDSNIIYCYAGPDNKEEYTNKLCDRIEKSLPGVINKSLLQMKRIENTMTNQRAESVFFGNYLDKISDDVPQSLLNKDGRIGLRGNSFIIISGVAYTLKSLSWRVLYCKDDRCALLCEDMIDFKNGGPDLKSWMTETFYRLAFSETEQLMVEEIRLLTEDDLQHIQDSGKLVFSQSKINPDGHWWIDSMAHGALQKVVKKDGKILSTGYNIRTKKSGVRPVIVVERETLMDIIKDNQQ